MREWKDHIPLRWKYTAGVAGDRFLSLLKNSSIQASICRNCNNSFLPPKIFCKDCFVQVTEWRELAPDAGTVYSYTKVKNGASSQYVALVKFDGVEGGLLGTLKSPREEPRIGMKVKAVFKPKDQRIGALSDISNFEKA
jgi:uncharacterized OB-fold protein